MGSTESPGYGMVGQAGASGCAPHEAQENEHKRV